jgi:hypothetical protein
MLNRAVLMEQLQKVATNLFLDNDQEYIVAYKAWQRICADPLFSYKIRQLQIPFLVPDWVDPLAQIIPIDPDLKAYCVLAVDGSQVYPDRHQGTACFLINIGSALFTYGTGSPKPVLFESTPFVYTDDDGQKEGTGPELINCKRQELELIIGLQKSVEVKKSLPAHTPFAFLVDGSLIFWHLESKDTLKDLFLNKYLASLHQLYQESILCGGYISLPKSKELVNLIRVELCNFQLEGCENLSDVDHIVDSTVVSFFLQPLSRSIVFKSNASINAHYPPHLVPYFFYMDVGAEIARIEIPAWIAQNELHITQLCQIILNQTIKGMGYPIALAESHEQAVIKGPDREFFYHVITKMGIDRKRQLLLSQKSMKKRGMGI